MTSSLIKDITNLYLYGSHVTPETLADENLIRRKQPSIIPAHLVNTDTFVSTGAGRFAVGRQLGFEKEAYEQFFCKSVSKLNSKTLS